MEKLIFNFVKFCLLEFIGNILIIMYIKNLIRTPMAFFASEGAQSIAGTFQSIMHRPQASINR